ncbi:sugar transferase [Streptomyces sp. NPDC020681]|uniref:sugar transferase n=1 Tax=Streptomyces sp. NPDC020681 TaxID=3365083 RepID=UPI00379C35A4
MSDKTMPAKRAAAVPRAALRAPDAKRVVDLAGGVILLLLLCPALLMIAAVAAVTCRGAVLARRDRAGQGGRTFTMLVFHMNLATPAGRTLHHHFLDQLPQLINVVRGEMSLVGPRPLPPAHRDRAAKLGVRPGITGLWQISGRSELPWEEMDVLDLHYVEQHWLGLDLKILVRTPAAAVAGRRPPRAVRLT